MPKCRRTNQRARPKKVGSSAPETVMKRTFHVTSDGAGWERFRGWINHLEDK